VLWDKGAHEEALFRLRTYWITYPTDEDALRFLMSVLMEQERYQEAREYYERLQICLAQGGREPHSLTQDLAAYARVKPIQNARLMTHHFKKEPQRSE
jgi:DNA-binding SARP family transcriptional activator